MARALRRLRPKVKPSAKLYKRKGRKGQTPTGLFLALINHTRG